MTDNQKVRIHGHLHKITRKLFVVTILLIGLIILVSFCTALILGNLAGIAVAQEDTLNQIMELRQELTPPEIDTTTSSVTEDQDSVALPLTDAERELVTRIVMAEARGDGYVGMLPVAQTILDRTTLWDMTVTEVVIAPGQYADPYKGEIIFEAQLAVSDVFDLGVRAFEEPVTHFAEGKPWWTAGKESRGSVGRHEFWY